MLGSRLLRRECVPVQDMRRYAREAIGASLWTHPGMVAVKYLLNLGVMCLIMRDLIQLMKPPSESDAGMYTKSWQIEGVSLMIEVEQAAWRGLLLVRTILLTALIGLGSVVNASQVP